MLSIRDRFAGAKPVTQVRKTRAGKIIERNGEKVAAYGDASGALELRSATCTHLGCTVVWNPAERTGRPVTVRAEATGQVIAGPAQSPLPEAE
jgi:Rieske Fe-S protein